MSQSFKEKVELMTRFVSDLEKDAAKADAGNKAARRRLRVALNQLRKDCFAMRKELGGVDGSTDDGNSAE